MFRFVPVLLLIGVICFYLFRKEESHSPQENDPASERSIRKISSVSEEGNHLLSALKSKKDFEGELRAALAQDERGVIELLSSSQEALDYESVADVIASYWIQADDWESRKEYFSMILAHPDLASYLLPQVIRVWGTESHEEARQWVLAQNAESSGLAESAYALGHFAYGSSIVHRFPDFLEPLAEEESTHIAYIRGYFEGLSHWDFDKTAEVLESLPEGAFRDAAVASFLNHSKEMDPAVSMMWARSIQDDSEKRDKILEVGRFWKETGPDAFEVWLETSELDEQIKADLR